MTEQEWLTCEDPDLLLEHLEGKVSRARLVQFVRLCWVRVAPDVAAAAGRSVVDEYAALAPGLSDHDAVLYASEAVLKAARFAAPAVKAEQARQADLLRQVVGNPFHREGPA